MLLFHLNSDNSHAYIIINNEGQNDHAPSDESVSCGKAGAYHFKAKSNATNKWLVCHQGIPMNTRKLSPITLMIVSLVLSACAPLGPSVLQLSPAPQDSPTAALNSSPTPTETAISIMLTPTSKISASTPAETATPVMLTATSSGRTSFNPSHRISFTSYRDGNAEVYTFSQDGTGLTNLTQHPANDLSPSWSPNGARIAFISDRDEGDLEIYVMNADGSEQTRLTDTQGEDSSPHWSPNGQKIVFSSMRDGNFHVWVMNADGSSPVRLTKDSDPHLYPAWLANGQIAFTRVQVGGNRIYLMNEDGTDQKRVDFLPPGIQAVWSPDAELIAFTMEAGNSTQIYTINADGTETRRITQIGQNGSPAWSPDSQRIAFVSDRYGDGDIFIMASDGSLQTRLTESSGPDLEPSWLPVP